MRSYKNAKLLRTDHRKANPASVTHRDRVRDSKNFKTVEQQHDPEGKFARSIKCNYIDSDGDGYKDLYLRKNRSASASKPDYRELAGGGGGAEEEEGPSVKELAYAGGLFESSDFTISTAHLMHFDSSYLDGAEPSTGESNPNDWKDRSGNPGNYSAQMDNLSYQTQIEDSEAFVGVYFQAGEYLSLYSGETKYTGSAPLEIPGEFTLISFAKRTNPEKGFTTLGYTELYQRGLHAYYPLGGGTDYVTGNAFTDRTADQVDFLDALAMRVTRRDSDHNYEHIEGGLSLFSGTKERVLKVDTIGKFNYAGGELEGIVYEIMLFDSYLSDDDLEIIKNYGNNKYGQLPEMPLPPPTYSADFDGADDFMTISADSAINFSGDMTVSAWIKADEWGAAGIAGVGSPYPGMFHLGTLTSGQFIFYGSTGLRKSVNTTFSAGNWYNITVSVQSGVTDGTKMYINGSLDSTGTTTITSRTDPLIAGKVSYSNSQHLNGVIHDVALFNSALSATDASNIYNSGVPTDLGSDGLNLSPVGWWRMGESYGGNGTTIPDHGSGGNDGTLVNGPTFSTDVPTLSSFSNRSVEFDGTDDHATPASTITLSGNKSISLWANLDHTYPQNFTSKDGIYYGLLLFGNSKVYLRTSGGVRTFNFSGSPWSSGVWNHWAVTGDGSDLKLYINGTAVGGTQTDGDILIAKFFAITGDYFVDGKIDEFACFNSTLSSSDITAIYNSGVAADLAGYSPVHWYRMGDINGGSGTTIADQGSGSVDMTLVNGPTYSTNTPS